MVGLLTLLILIFCQLGVDGDTLRKAMVMNSSSLEENKLPQHVRVLRVASVAPAWCVFRIHDDGLWPSSDRALR